MAETDLLDNILDRAHALLAEETAALEEFRAADYTTFSVRKSMILFELNAIFRGKQGHQFDGNVRKKLGSLRAKLQENRDLLEAHIDAGRAIAKILADVVRSAEWDGTYTAVQARQGQKA